MTDLLRRPAPYQGPPPGLWYGQDPAWLVPLEAKAKRTHQIRLRAARGTSALTYRLDALDVSGRDAVPVTIRFDASAAAHHYGLPPRDMPRVYADPGTPSPHRNPDDSLCLYYPFDPEEQRWHSELGLDVLLDLVADHLFAELYWRKTGGPLGGVWVLNEAPHGIPEESS